MTSKEAVRLIDPTAKFSQWSTEKAGWVHGNGWETKITYSEQRAWELAIEEIATSKAAA